MKNRPYYGSRSQCHGSPSLIVLSRPGGLVSQNCIECGKPRLLSSSELPTIICDLCSKEMKSFINADKNYAYECQECGKVVVLPNIVPLWQDRFEYHGLGLDSDYLDAYGRG